MWAAADLIDDDVKQVSSQGLLTRGKPCLPCPAGLPFQHFQQGPYPICPLHAQYGFLHCTSMAGLVHSSTQVAAAAAAEVRLQIQVHCRQLTMTAQSRRRVDCFFDDFS